jgi:hypothetical protein
VLDDRLLAGLDSGTMEAVRGQTNLPTELSTFVGRSATSTASSGCSEALVS